MDRVVTISVSRNHEAVMVKGPGPPPRGGAASDGVREALQARENFQNTIANIQHAPSFIGEIATSRLIGLSQRSS